MTYEEYRERKQTDVNSLPIFFAFNMKQFEEALKERGLKLEEAKDNVYRLGSGGYYLKKDRQIIYDYFNKPDELSKLMEDYDFAVDAIYYEMCNHEYGINWQGDWDVCSVFGKVTYKDTDDELESYFEELKWSETTQKAYFDAKRKYNKDAIENEWF